MKNKKLLSLLLSALMILSMASFVPAATLDQPAVTPASDSNDGEQACSYIDVDYEVPSLEGVNLPAQYTADSLPAAYSSVNKGIITSVKNQGSYGCCWAFAATACAEASLVRLGYSAHDLSESQLAYFTYNSATDPLGLTAGDSTTNVGSDFLNRGGNSIFTTWQLAKWSGLEDETAHSSLNYANASTSLTIPSAYAYVGQAHMQNVDMINMSDKDTVKQLLMNYGAAAISFYSSSSYRKFDYNTKCYAYYQNKTTGTNHAVTLVGWDDNYSASNFPTTPSSNGAWLIKNSWGSSNSNTGYIWVSYEDTSIKDNTAYFFQFEPSSNYAKNYQYDGSIGARTDYVKNGGKIANVFTAQDNELIKAVSVGLRSVDVTYTVNIYTGLTNSSNPESGNLVSSTTGYIPYAGYHTIPLSAPVSVPKGQSFSVVFTLNTSSDSYVDYNIDESYQNSTWIKFVSNVQRGQSFYKYTSTSTWTDTYTYDYNIRIKAFTSNAVQAFVSRLYSVVLGRTPDEAGINNWSNLLMTGSQNGATASYGFVFSDEFNKRNLSNAEKVDVMYRAFLNREADAAGKAMWVNALDAGVGLEKIYEGFVMSSEFASLCSEYGISAGSMSDVPGMADRLNLYRNRNINITQFVARCYTMALGRTNDLEGVEMWCRLIITGEWAPTRVAADGFFHSDEFVARNTSNEEYVRILYRTFFGREADADGLNTWINLLASGAYSRDQVLAGFSESDEFKTILASFGL